MELLPFFLDDEEDILLYELANKKSRLYHHITKSNKIFNLEDLSDDYCWLHFRFHKCGLVQLVQLLEIPEWILCSEGAAVRGIEALCILLKRLSYPNRYCDLMTFFPRSQSELSRIFNRTISIILRKHQHRIASLNQIWLTMQRVAEMSDTLVKKGSPYKNCFGVLDGTVRPICRPKTNQREFYNGHKRVHAIKFQSVLVPNGLVVHLSEPVVGRRHDGYLLQSSKLIRQLETRFFDRNGDPYHLYGDAAYPLHPHLITPFKSHRLTPSRRKCNKSMSSIRQSVEWGFNKVIQLFAFLDFKKNLKIGLQPIGAYYKVAMIFGNCHTCLYGSETTSYFDCPPPKLDEYLS